MSRGEQPLAITHRQWTPRTTVRQPMRANVRRQMFGPLQPADSLTRKFSWWRIISFAVYAVCTVYAVKLWVVG